MQGVTPAETAAPDHEPGRMLLGAKELAVLLGQGLRTIRRHNTAGKIPRPVRIGGRVLWDRQEIQQWIAARCLDRADWERILATSAPARKPLRPA